MKLVVFTDLDATLLDPETYSWAPARKAIEHLKAIDSALVLVSSKTFAEMRPLHGDLALDDPFVFENGGGIAVKSLDPAATLLASEIHQGEPVEEDEYLLFGLGTEYGNLTESLRQISQELGVPLEGFSSMTNRRVASLTGLDLSHAAQARDRRFDEPFLVPQDVRCDPTAILSAAEKRGLVAVQGGRFWHLIGHGGKGAAVSALIAVYTILADSIRTVGLGDSPNDFPFLELVDIPVLAGDVMPGTTVPPFLTFAHRTPEPGPAGWNRIMLQILGEQALISPIDQESDYVYSGR